MVHRLVSVGTVKEEDSVGARLARRRVAAILYEKYPNEITSKIAATPPANDAAPERADARRGEWA
ncbi:hypothetical protein AAB992_34945 [Burkholderia contaminans]|uniref:hypothetical protein n=1 Tax=Burkholderia contaminans TaxID=488447 RepID=UPI0024175A28|nr:hypothetical protein [Burkholderia contaminans]WFN12415.1 hypothetical protein LXE92_29450 [Burkholderia contaminans]